MTNKTAISPETIAQLVQVKLALNLAEELGMNADVCCDFFSDLLTSLGTDLDEFDENC